jgi:ABC-type transporter Mla MlaB component
MTAQPPREITCDADALAADATAVDALARLQLGARRQGSEIRLSGASAELEALLAFCGLGDLFRTPREPRPPPPA